MMPCVHGKIWTAFMAPFCHCSWSILILEPIPLDNRNKIERSFMGRTAHCSSGISLCCVVCCLNIDCLITVCSKQLALMGVLVIHGCYGPYRMEALLISLYHMPIGYTRMILVIVHLYKILVYSDRLCYKPRLADKGSC